MILKKLFTFFALIVFVQVVAAQDQNIKSTIGDSSNGLSYLVWMLIIILIFQSLIIYRLVKFIREQQYRLINGVEMEEEMKRSVEVKKVDKFARFYASLTRSVPAGKQKDVMLSHNYDGIQEMDNRMPPWLQMIFYFTIFFAVVYLFVFHVYHIGMLPKDEYARELRVAEEERQDRLKTAALSIDETNVQLIAEPSALSEARTLFTGKCAACHGMKGEGGVGPNLTDSYWLHGGSIGDVFKTVKYGVPAKGMVSWKGILKPEEMQEVSSYILSLSGTNPANAKPPQGDLYVPPASAENVSDSTKAIPDSSKLLSEQSKRLIN